MISDKLELLDSFIEERIAQAEASKQIAQKIQDRLSQTGADDIYISKGHLVLKWNSGWKKINLVDTNLDKNWDIEAAPIKYRILAMDLYEEFVDEILNYFNITKKEPS